MNDENNKKKQIKEQIFYKVKKQYSITINPIDRYQWLHNIKRVRKFRNHFYEVFMAEKYQYELFIEFSEPRGFHTQGYSGPRLHMHGTISFNDIKELGYFLSQGYSKLLKYASVDIDTIDDIDKWKAYCTKQKIIKKNRISNYIKK